MNRVVRHKNAPANSGQSRESTPPDRTGAQMARPKKGGPPPMEFRDERVTRLHQMQNLADQSPVVKRLGALQSTVQPATPNLSGQVPLQRKSLRQAGKQGALEEKPKHNFHEPSAGPTKGFVYQLPADQIPNAPTKVGAINKAAELYAEKGNPAGTSITEDIQSSEQVRLSKKFVAGQPNTFDAIARQQIPNELGKAMEKPNANVVNQGANAQAAIDQYIQTQSAGILQNKSKIPLPIIQGFGFDWSNLYSGKLESSNKVLTKKGTHKDFTFAEVNKAPYTAYDDADQLKAQLRTDFRDKYAVDSDDYKKTEAAISGVEIQANKKVPVEIKAGFDGAFKGKIQQRVTGDHLLDDNNVALIDPYFFKAIVRYGAAPHTLEMLYQHAVDWPGYVIHVADGGEGFAANMVPKDLSDPNTAGIPDEYRRDHAQSGDTNLTGALQIDPQKSKGENSEVVDAYAKLAGEGARFICVREAAAGGSLSNNTYFYALGKGKNGIDNPGIQFKYLWLAWAREFSKANNISNATFATKLKDCEGGKIKLIDGEVDVTPNANQKADRYEVK